MKKILFVSIAFPPKWDSEGLQVAKYFKYLSRKKELELSVVTSKIPTLNMPTDKTLEAYAKGYKQLIEVPIFENKYTNFLIRKIFPWFLQKPDSKFSFAWGWKKVTQKLESKPDLIYSRSFPLSSALMAYQLKKYYKVPWIFHVSDPWVDNHIDPRHPKALPWNIEMEKNFFEHADKIIVTSLKTQEFYQRKYPAHKDKIDINYNVYDRETTSENPHSFKDKLRFVCTGVLTLNRSPEKLFKAIELMTSRNPAFKENAEFIFTGQADRVNRAILSKYSHLNFKHLGLVSFPEVIALQKSADVLIVIDTAVDNVEDGMFFLSKILDYINAQRKIIGFTTKGTTTYQSITDNNGDCCDPLNVEEIAVILENCWLEFKNGNSEYFYNKNINELYDAEKNVDKLTSIIQEICDHKIH
jgi:hypothetical protein